MGCDIHGWVEKKVDGRWVAVKELQDCTRNYERFSRLAGVRGHGPRPLGVPVGVSDTALFWIKDWDTDGHSHGHMPLATAFEVFKATAWPEDEKRFYSEWTAFGIEIEGSNRHRWEDFRLVFWFDN